MKIHAARHDDRATLLHSIQQFAESSLKNAGYQMLSPFAERHGAWELRLFRERDHVTHFISLATELLSTKSPRFEIWAGASVIPHPGLPSPRSERLQIANLVFAGFPASSEKFSNALRNAAAAAADLEARLTPGEDRLPVSFKAVSA